jgi:hypothetical protein
VGAKEIVAKVAAGVKVSPGLGGEAEYMWDAARLEALTVYLGPVEKITANGPKTYEYYFASWKMGDKVVNKYIGSPRKMTREAATAKARKLKAEGIKTQSVRRDGKRASRYTFER